MYEPLEKMLAAAGEIGFRPRPPTEGARAAKEAFANFPVPEGGEIRAPNLAAHNRHERVAPAGGRVRVHRNRFQPCNHSVGPRFIAAAAGSYRLSFTCGCPVGGR